MPPCPSYPPYKYLVEVRLPLHSPTHRSLSLPTTTPVTRPPETIMSSYCENIDQYFEYPYDETPTEPQPPSERFLIDEYSYLPPNLQQPSSFSVIPSSLRDSDTYRHPMGPMNDWDPNMIMLENIEPEVQMEVPQYVNPKDAMPHTDRYGLARHDHESFIKPPSYTSSKVTFAQPPPSPPEETLRRSRRTSSTTRAPQPPKSNLKSPRKPAPRASHSFQPYQLPTPPPEGAGPSRPRANPPKRELPTRTRKPSLRARGGDAY
ncbi:hypothetical protein DL93DRAFT_1584301 [Clavulina sp. PMI_390]|nr:hypothetical protein DL93DRAFT_1584301 [Clavulina sp. PMI_390]